MRAASWRVRLPLVLLLLLPAFVALTGACARPLRTPGAPAVQPKPHAVGRAGASRRDPGAPVSALAGDYHVTYDGRGSLLVEADVERGARFSVESGAEPFVHDFGWAPTGGPESGQYRPGERDGRTFVAAGCKNASCRIRYRYALREAAKKIDDLDVASEEGEVLEAPPSTWILAPEDANPASRVRFHVTTGPDRHFVTGVLRSREVADAWDIALEDLWTAPYSAFGPLRTRTLEIAPDPATAAPTAPARIELAVAPGKLVLSDEEIAAWVTGAGRAIVAYFGSFPLPEALVLLVPARGRWIGEGKTLSGGGGSIFIRVGEKVSVQALRDDWVLVHEMTHLTFPSVAREHDWAEEGLATYVEPFARARAGLMTPEAAWQSLVEGLPNGLPAAGDRGLDRTPTWGRTYWGGALFYLLADIDLRRRTDNRRGLEHALRGILDAGGNNTHRWALEEAFAAGDRATGTTALQDLHAAMGNSPHPVDLEALWRSLGISRVSRGVVRFDDTAPLAAVRRAITTGH